MRQLHLVEHDAASGSVVLETADGLEKFALPVDDALRRALSAAAATPSRPGVAAGEPQISPREIQMRIRAGDSAEHLADMFGASLDWVLRFAAPVLAERTRIADEARRARARRSTTDGQAVVFGEAVDARFTAHGIDPATVRWDALRRDDGKWVVLAHWIGAQAERTAEWSFQLSGRTVAPLDDAAADLLSDRPIRPVVAPAPPEPLTLAPTAPDQHTGPLPRVEEVYDQDRPASAPAAPARDDRSARADRSADRRARDDRSRDDRARDDGDDTRSISRVRPPAAEPEPDEPQLPMHVPDAPAGNVRPLAAQRRQPESEDEKSARASIPSWDDILLGVRRKQD